MPEVFVIPVVPMETPRPTIDDFLQRGKREDALTFTRVPFNYPLMICYSSVTTGAPKCIVHQQWDDHSAKEDLEYSQLPRA